MLFLWTITKRGKIWLDGEAFRQIVAKRLPNDFYCQEVSFIGDQNLLNVYVVLPDADDPQKRLAIMDRLEEFFKPMGIAVAVHWTRKLADEYGSGLPVWRKPVFWGLAAGGVVGLVHLGLRGILWAAGATVSGYLISWLAITEDGNKLVSRMINDIKNIRR